ncbi:unnamed protein product [Protopolystoma xenopodis]|uniref:Uncharacterized protein n=1 Tax=Protopolystoma xenopodis TaxID=117903 RepID=A0A448WL11_9PLAT|nr:unnamed protein product [Protopolystoma xenopodis]
MPAMNSTDRHNDGPSSVNGTVASSDVGRPVGLVGRIGEPSPLVRGARPNSSLACMHRRRGQSTESPSESASESASPSTSVERDHRHSSARVELRQRREKRRVIVSATGSLLRSLGVDGQAEKLHLRRNCHHDGCRFCGSHLGVSSPRQSGLDSASSSSSRDSRNSAKVPDHPNGRNGKSSPGESAESRGSGRPEVWRQGVEAGRQSPYDSVPATVSLDDWEAPADWEAATEPPSVVSVLGVAGEPHEAGPRALETHAFRPTGAEFESRARVGLAFNRHVVGLREFVYSTTAARSSASLSGLPVRRPGLPQLGQSVVMPTGGALEHVADRYCSRAGPADRVVYLSSGPPFFYNRQTRGGLPSRVSFISYSNHWGNKGKRPAFWCL